MGIVDVLTDPTIGAASAPCAGNIAKRKTVGGSIALRSDSTFPDLLELTIRSLQEIGVVRPTVN